MKIIITFRPFEFNVKFERSDGEWIVGRKLGEWDWAEYFWNRDLWQPTYTDDALRPKWGGLTGIFRDFKYAEGQATLFGSFLFIPNFTPPFENINGEMVSDNPWFITPASGKVGSTNMVPAYIVKELNLKNFLKFSVAGRASYKGLHLAYAYKPMNKIRVKSPVVLPLNQELRGTHETGYLVDIPLEPVILQHHLINGGFILEASDKQNEKTQEIFYRLKTSFTYNHPITHTLENDSWIFFQPQEEWHTSVKGEIHIKDPFEETILHAAYTHQFHPSEAKKNTLSKILPKIEKQLFRDNLFQFSRAASTGIEHNIKFNKTQEATIKTRLIYHLLTEYFLFSFYGSVTFEEVFSVFISGDLIFSDFPFSIDQTTQDIGVYTNKSRIFGGLSYAF